jgi:hypothetical protein
MAASAKVIDLSEVRRQRAVARGTAAEPMRPMPMLMPWTPVWVFVPFWMFGAASSGVAAYG